MKKQYFLTAIAAFTIVTICSCSRAHSDATINNAWNAPNTVVNSFNEYDLVASNQYVSYTIDVSTPEGKTKLHKKSEKQANELALAEAVIKYKCSMLINPQFTHLKKGKKILRVTIFGQPAYYKKQEKPTQKERSTVQQSRDKITINRIIQYHAHKKKSGKRRRCK